MSFCTAITCMDGRVQLPVNNYLKKRFQTAYVDTITEPGPEQFLAEADANAHKTSILDRLAISVDNHQSRGVALICHHDCAGNPISKEEKIAQVRKAIAFLDSKIEQEVIGLWVDSNWDVHELD